MQLAAIVSKRRRHKPSPSLLRHQRKCRICNHKDRQLIEFDFLVWKSAQSIVDEYRLGRRCLLYRHAHATGSLQLRKENFRSALDAIIEQAESAPVTGATIIRAMRAYSCLRDDRSWVDLPTQHTVSRINQPSNASRNPNRDTAIKNPRNPLKTNAARHS